MTEVITDPAKPKNRTKKTNEIVVERYATFARWRTDLLRIENRCLGPHADSDDGLEDDIKKCMFLTIIRRGDSAFGYVLTKQLWPETAYIAYVCIDPEFQHKGYLKAMMETVEDELRTIGYTHFEINARIATLAGKIGRAYGDRIEVRYEHGSAMGPMEFFRVALKRPVLGGAPPTGEQQEEKGAV